ncbi:hypothetical protein EVAR_80293_1 [Eumeta japonica]|uniref:MADF domain-containing protein n=1 Tax=Eumeta variegata TaxID=151549 RepID=A0A4C1UCL8_EUMVA|nr:hypothetical protein EVAR_102136_1 [Eumeta japonica]GBP23676.1 hypothetical protein EVAR_80293_1 [Eumeta japonica]
MTDDLIELVRQRKVIYDSKCKDYKDHFMRNAAWEEIAEILEQPESPPTEESPDESLPESPSTSRSQSQSSSSRGKPNKEPKLQELYDLMKSSQDLRRQKQNFRQDMDETDLFFLSMSKELKALPKLEQTK